mgnify:CR=1 FL=1
MIDLFSDPKIRICPLVTCCIFLKLVMNPINDIKLITITVIINHRGILYFLWTLSELSP